jgi:hypothetical protein
MTTPTQIEDSHTDEAQRAAIERESLALPAGQAETHTAIRFQRIVGRFGSEIIFERGIAKVGYKIFGSGESGSVDLPFYRLDYVSRVLGPWTLKTQIDQAARVVHVTLLGADVGGLAAGETAEIWLVGNGS